jgi:hypothetical protein
MVISVTMERAVMASRRRNDEKAILFSTSLGSPVAVKGSVCAASCGLALGVLRSYSPSVTTAKSSIRMATSQGKYSLLGSANDKIFPRWIRFIESTYLFKPDVLKSSLQHIHIDHAPFEFFAFHLAAHTQSNRRQSSLLYIHAGIA